MASAMFYVMLWSCVVVPAVTDLMRAEQREANVGLHLGAHGEVRTLKEMPQPEATKSPLGEKLDVNDLFKQQAQAKAKAGARRQNDMCDYDFPLGKENKDECKETDHRIDDREQCHEAARQNFGDDKQHFMLDSNWFDVHPEGCFAAACDAAKVNATEHPNVNFTGYKGLCYYFNPTGDPPAGPIAGTPVCERSKFLNATAPNVNVGGCHDGYERIYNEFVCHKVGGCLSDPDAPDFRVGIKNFSQHFDFPRGCFIAEDGEVYYNPIKDPTGVAIPVKADAVVYGMPICAVTGKAGNEEETTETTEETGEEGKETTE
jgi:hypothetical protein